MFSVIIPTLFCVDRIYRTLIELSLIDIVGEIILIDNTDNKDTIKLNKLQHLCQGKNTYVNNAWNLGVSVSRFDKICLLNDDVWFDWSIFNIINELVTPEKGFIGMHPNNFRDWGDSERFYDGGLTLVSPMPDNKTKNGYRPINWGACIFFDKSNWDKIPEDLKIWAGDDWLFYRSKKPNYIAHGIKCHGEESQTIKKNNVGDIIEKDMNNMLGWIKKGEVDNYLLNTIWEK